MHTAVTGHRKKHETGVAPKKRNKDDGWPQPRTAADPAARARAIVDGDCLLAHHLTSFLNEEEQRAVVDECLAVSLLGDNGELPFHQSLRQPDAAEDVSRGAVIHLQGDPKAPTPVLFYNWQGRPASKGIPEPCFMHVALRALERVRQSQAAPQPPAAFRPCAAYAITYGPDATFGMHVDGSKGWVVSISVGASAAFTVSESQAVCPGGAAGVYKICTGDVMVFNGGQ
eukprot:gene4009-4361_t